MDISETEKQKNWEDLKNKPDVFITKSELVNPENKVIKYINENKRFKARIWGGDKTETIFETDGFKWYDYELEGYKAGNYELSEKFKKMVKKQGVYDG